MSKKTALTYCLSLILLLIPVLICGTWRTALATGLTGNSWPSFRHDLLNSGAAADSGYPATATKLWMINRAPRSWDPAHKPADSRGPSVVDRGMVITAGSGVIQANDQFTGSLIWSKYFLWQAPSEPAGAPTDWCYNDIPSVEGNTGICYVANIGDCPSWCFECTTDEPDCTSFSLTLPLAFPAGYDQFLASPTVDPTYGANGCVIFGTFDGRVISLDMADGTTNWEKTPYKDPGGPNVGKPWYNQKFAWHLSPPSMADGKVFIGSFLPSFYAIFRPWAYVTPGQPGYPWPTIGNDATNYWVGRDGYFYGLDEDNGSVRWTWNPRGCGVTNIAPVKDGKVFIEADTATDYHYGQFATVDASTGAELWHVGTIPLAQGGTQAVSGNTLFAPGGDGALWALNINTGQVQWGYHAGFNVRGHTALCSAPAVDESRSWVIGIADTGHMFVLNKDTGRVEKEAFLGLPTWNVFDPHPDSGYWLPGPSGIAISPQDGLLYVAGTDYDRAWLGSQFDMSREKLFCYDYVTDPNTLILKWSYQFCKDDNCSIPANELIIRGHGPYVVAWYSVPSPALADGHVYYASTNGKIYCFGDPYPTDDTDTDSVYDYRDNCATTPNGASGGTCSKGTNDGDPCTVAGNNTVECGTGGFCSMNQEDEDGNQVGDVCDTCTDSDGDDYGNAGFPGNTCTEDNCPYAPNGTGMGSCVKIVGGVKKSTGVVCSDNTDCSTGQTCDTLQGDMNSDGIGDCCECYADIAASFGKVDLNDLVVMKGEFLKPCPPSPCTSDLNVDGKVDLNDLVVMKTEFLSTGCPI